MTKTPKGLEEGRTSASAGKPVARTPPPIPNVCSHCKQKLGESRVVVHTHDHRGGHFHTGQCYAAALAVEEPWDYRARIADVESVRGLERTMWELIRPQEKRVS